MISDKKASEVRASTDLRVAEILAEAAEESARELGAAEAEAARIYADAHSLDPDFYRFLRQLQALETLLGAGSTVILRTDSAPFGLLKDPGLPDPEEAGEQRPLRGETDE